MKNDGIEPKIIYLLHSEQPVPELLITSRGAVYPWHCDHMGHMNMMWYTGRFDEAMWLLMGHMGLIPSCLRKNKRGMAAVQQQTTYKRELVPGSLITIRNSGNA